MRSKLDNATLGTASGLAAIVLWSVTIAFARSLSEQLGPVTAGAATYLFAGALALLRMGWTRTSLRDFRQLPPRYLFGCGSLFVAYSAFLFLAVGLADNREQVLEIGLINYLWPTATVLFSLLLLNKHASLLLIPGTLVALAGAFLVMTDGNRVSWNSFCQHLESNPAAYLIALLAALTWALYSNLARRWSAAGTRGAVTLFLPITGLVLLGMRLFISETTRWSVPSLGEIIVLGVTTALAYPLWDFAMRRGNLLLVATCSYFTPLLSTLVNCLYLQVFPGPSLWTGCLLLVAGSLLTWRSVSDRSRIQP